MSPRGSRDERARAPTYTPVGVLWRLAEYREAALRPAGDREVERLVDQPVSSPAATGGAGPFFEQHVGAYWLAQLLVGAIPPILTNTTVREVQFQTEYLGWQTDDFLVTCTHPDGRLRKLVGQVKRTFTVSTNDEDCRSTVADFWRDFNNSARFSQEDDRLVLVTLRGTNTLLQHFSGLLDLARAATNGDEFEQRLGTKGFVSSKADDYCRVLQEIVESIEGHSFTKASLWPFLSALHVLALDLNSSTGQAEAAIKSLLAYTVLDGAGLGEAAASWNALLALAATAIPEARHFRREDLPLEVRERHGLLGNREQIVLQALTDHSFPVLNRIKGTIGPLHLSRADVVQKAREVLDTAQVTIVAGPAGTGKSSIAKDLIADLGKDHFVFAFRAEEFAEAHIDRTLQAAQIGVRAAELTAILGGQERVIILIESVERLLEKSTRDAFSDLIRMIENDDRFRVVLTCRGYSLEIVCASFLQPEGVTYKSILVPMLTDKELEQVAATSPGLEYPLSKPALREVLRNPYFLDRALQIEWPADRSTPESEREFREMFWRQIVRADRLDGGIAQRREEAFHSIAVRRARALSDFVTSRELDSEAVSALRRDSLITSPEADPALVAPAHDVLEDWAILHWMDEQFARGQRSLDDLSEAIGPHPAIRRSFRAWIGELVDRDPPGADRLFRSSLSAAGVSAQFRDDTLVSLLKAPTAGAFLDRHVSQLVANNCEPLKRVVHLLRVACVVTPPWLADARRHGSVLNVPEGAAWASVLRLVHRNLDRLSARDEQLLLGLIEDAVRGVSWWSPELDGAESVAAIAHTLLPENSYYGSDKWLTRVLSVLAKIPRADPARFEAILRGPSHEGSEQDTEGDQSPAPFLPRRHRRVRRLDRATEELRTLLFSGIEGAPTARDLPDVVVSVAEEYLFATEEDASDSDSWGGALDLGLWFGVRDEIDHDFFPASAFRGLWLPLLRYHPAKARDLLIAVFNRSGDWYAHPRVDERLEPAWEIEFTFADGTRQKQWANLRLWQLYRGTSVGPYVLQSLLMAFEKWLLEYAETHPDELDGILVDTLRRSESAMLTAVVAGVATAHPHLAGEALLVLLTSSDCIRLDQARLAAERGTFSVSDLFGVRAVNAVYDGERKQADQMPHRKAHLETALANLQLGPLADRVHAILDRHLADLEALPEQDRSTMAWRLALQRMDLRRYTFSPETDLEPDQPEGEPADERSSVRIRLEPDPLAPDLEQFVAEGEAERATIGSQLGILNWGLQAFRGEHDDGPPDGWREMLQRAQHVDREAEDPLGARNGPAYVAAVVIRDHWDEASPDERDWCVEVACREVERTSDDWADLARVQRFEMAGDRPSARSVSLLVRKRLAATQADRVRRAWAAVVTHPVDEVRWYGVWSIDAQFWSDDRELVLRCVNAIANDASIVDQGIAAEAARPWQERRHYSEIGSEAARAVRQHFWERNSTDYAYSTLPVLRGAGADALQKLLVIFGHAPADGASVDVLTRASTTLVGWWNSDQGRGQRAEVAEERDFGREIAFVDLLARFVLRMDPPSAQTVLAPLLGEVDSHPDKLADFVQHLTLAEDRRPNTSQYWYVWSLFAERIGQSSWHARLDRERPWGGEMLSAMFLTSGWKEDVRHWRSLEGHSNAVHALFESLPPTPIVLEDYLRFLHHIGEQSLPDAFVRVATALRTGDVRAMLAASNTVFLLEILLQRHVYGRPLELKREPELRNAVLELLDMLVEAGSSAAFRMRDDFVTPA